MTRPQTVAAALFVRSCDKRTNTNEAERLILNEDWSGRQGRAIRMSSRPLPPREWVWTARTVSSNWPCDWRDQWLKRFNTLSRMREMSLSK